MAQRPALQPARVVFEGKVLSEETRLLPANGRPFTYFTFEVTDVIKGSYELPTIEIGYMGGQLGDVIMQVSDMRMPEVGERGIYFVETLSEQQVHPLFGWQQGHYLVITQPQTETDVVVPVDQVESSKSVSKSIRPVTIEDFKRRIRNAEGEEQ